MKMAVVKREEVAELVRRKGDGVHKALVKVLEDGSVVYDCSHPAWKGKGE